MFELTDGREALYQWDTGRMINVADECTQLHFSSVEYGVSVDVDVDAETNTAKIPDALLTVHGLLYVYGFIGSSGNGYTKVSQTFDVKPRPKPADYVYTADELKTYEELETKIQEIDGQIANLQTEFAEQITNTQNELSGQISDVKTNLSAQVENVHTELSEQISSAKSELEDIRTAADGTTYETAGEAVRAQVNEIKGDLVTKADNVEFKALLNELNAEITHSKNVFDDTEYVGTKMTDLVDVMIFNGDFKYLDIGTEYYCKISYTDGTYSNPNLAWKFLYDGGTYTTMQAIGAQIIPTEKPIGFAIIKTASYDNSDFGKEIEHIWITSDSNAYVPFEIQAKSERIENIETTLNKAMLDTNYMTRKNLLTDDNTEDNVEVQPYTTAINENYCSAYIPVRTGQTLYVNYKIGTNVAWLCKADKTKISWVTMNHGNDKAARNTGYTVETEDVEFIRLSWKKSISVHTAYGTNTFDLFFSTEPIRFKCADKQFDEQYIPELNTGRLNNWWYLKEGDSLGDSLTGQGFFQKWTKQYCGLKSFSNHGVGGSKLSGADIDSTRPSMWKDERIEALSTTADFVTVLGGQNDGDVAIGDIIKTNYDTNTYVGALNTIIDKIYDHCKQGVIIILCTPFYVPAEGDAGERFKILDNAVREVGKLRGLPVADFGGLCTADKKTADLYWGTDRTHPNENFYRDKIAPILISTMESIKPINWENVNYYD